MLFSRNSFLVALTVILAAGCQTDRMKPVSVMEVTLPDVEPYVMPVPIVTSNLTPSRASASAAPSAPDRPPLGPARPPHAWVALGSWCAARGLRPPKRLPTGAYVVRRDPDVLTIEPGSQVVEWNGTRVWLGSAPQVVRGEPALRWIDVQKTLEPLLHGADSVMQPGRVIVIDPGHGGSDSGTHGTKDQLEKHFVLDWAWRLEPLLRAQGWKVFLTRTNDVDLSLADRVAFADRVQADLFVSLHFNGLEARADHAGVETFCLTPVGMPSSVTRGYEDDVEAGFPNNAWDQENLRYAYRLHREVLAATRAADGGVRRARFMGVLRGQRRPAVLIEGGFLSNPEEAQRVATPAYRQKLAEAVARAVK